MPYIEIYQLEMWRHHACLCDCLLRFCTEKRKLCGISQKNYKSCNDSEREDLCVPIPHSLLSCILISSSKLSISSLNRRNSPNKPPTQLLAFGFVVFVNHWDGNPFSFNLLSHVYNGRYYRQGAVHYSYFLLRIFPCKQNLFQARVKFIRYSGIIQYLYINNSTVVTDLSS